MKAPVRNVRVTLDREPPLDAASASDMSPPLTSSHEKDALPSRTLQPQASPVRSMISSSALCPSPEAAVRLFCAEADVS
jgi:hypothetical protein